MSPKRAATSAGAAGAAGAAGSAAEETGGAAYSVRAVERVCDILSILGNASAPVGFTELASAAALPKPTAVRYLAVLEGRRFVHRDVESNRYTLGSAALGLRNGARERLLTAARPLLEQLRDDTGETVNLGVLDRASVTYLAIVESQRAVRLAAKPADRDLLHCTALGKALAARMPDDWVRAAIADAGMPARTRRSLTTFEALRRELAAVRRNGFAVDDRENEDDGRCVAVAIPDPTVRAAVSVSAPAARLPLTEVPAVAAKLHEVAGRIAARLQATAGPEGADAG